MLDDVDVESPGARVRFRQTDAAELRIREDRCREDRVVGCAVTAREHVVDGDPRLVLRGRREHRARRYVARSPDALDARALVFVDDDAMWRRLHSDAVELERIEARDSPPAAQDIRNGHPPG